MKERLRTEAEERAWREEMAALEEERGPLVPGGAQGGPKRRKEAVAVAAARGDLRGLFQVAERDPE